VQTDAPDLVVETIRRMHAACRDGVTPADRPPRFRGAA
jgi:hypothetical protein